MFYPQIRVPMSSPPSDGIGGGIGGTGCGNGDDTIIIDDGRKGGIDCDTGCGNAGDTGCGAGIGNGGGLRGGLDEGIRERPNFICWRFGRNRLYRKWT